MIVARGRVIRAADAERSQNEPNRADRLADAAALVMRAEARAADDDDRALDRVVSLSRLLAERLLGRALDLAPDTIVALAREVLFEARSARRVHVFVNPAHVAALEAAAGAFDPEGRVHVITGDPALDAGDVRLETELGTVEARLDGELDQLAHRLRAVLGS